MNYYKIFKNNWKKITFGTIVACYGINYMKSQYDISQHLRSICSIVSAYSEKIDSEPKNVLVILNPVAKNKKAESLFRKYCEPILHLAGYSVDLLKTNHVGHAKSYIEHLSVMPDIIVVAGGDGTSSEVVTGLMRRDHTASPIVLLPLGSKSNTSMRYIKEEPKNKFEHVKLMTNILLNMVQDQYHYENIIQFDVIEDDSDEMVRKKLKPIYGLHQFSWGLLRDIDAIKDKYWYFGNLRYMAAVFLKSFSNDLTWKFGTDFVYTPPCAGCDNCKKKKTKPISKSYISRLLTTKINENHAEHVFPRNDNCKSEVLGHLDTNQLYITCKRNEDEFYELQSNFINSLEPGFSFVKDIPNITNNNVEPEVILKSRTIKLIPRTITDKDSYYTIDGEEYDVRPIKISLIPNAIKVIS